ncbi:MAG: glycosyltransferase family 4 protein [Chitinophagales bacterium]|nr:glycosyltransferase family 4 protein [Chitinophagales bacterium]
MDYGKIRVLMLGWEFPPIVTGGLGPACYGLAKALAGFTDLKIILPKSDLNFKMRKVNILGLNHFTFDPIGNELFLADYRTFLATEFLTHELNNQLAELRVPYYSYDISGFEAISLFNESDSYGINVIRKVQAYAEVVEKLADTIDFDLIHAHDWITYPAGIKLKEKTGKPLLVHVHSLETDRANPDVRNQVYFIEKNGLEAADHILPVSEYTKHSIINYYGINPDKISPVYNAIEAAHVYKIQRTDGQKWVLFLGRITRQKGPEFLFETIVKLSRRMTNVKFYIAGSGDLAEDLKIKVANAGLNDAVVFTGFINRQKIEELLASADAYFMPSVSEPFGLSALEAAQFNVPCVISKQSGVNEVLFNVLKADCWDTNKLSDYLYGVLNYAGLRDTMVRLTANDIRNISWDNSAREVLKSYKRMVPQVDVV